MESTKVLELFKNTRLELADGMRDVDFEDFPWGYRFNWPKLPLFGTAISVITSEPSEKSLAEIKEWLAQDSNHEVLALPEIDIDIEFNKIPQLTFLYRPSLKKRAPFIPNYTIRHFSFDNRDLRIDSRKMTAALSTMVSKDRDERIQAERYIGGVLHMLKGKIWTLEDNNENILAAVLLTLQHNPDYLTIEVTGELSADTDYLDNLLQTIYEQHGDVKIIYPVIVGSRIDQLLRSHDFRELVNLKRAS